MRTARGASAIVLCGCAPSRVVSPRPTSAARSGASILRTGAQSSGTWSTVSRQTGRCARARGTPRKPAQGSQPTVNPTEIGHKDTKDTKGSHERERPIWLYGSFSLLSADLCVLCVFVFSAFFLIGLRLASLLPP